MNNTLTVSIRNVYGNELVYPACETSHLFAKLLGTKTFTAHHVAGLKALGYVFAVATSTVKL